MKKAVDLRTSREFLNLSRGTALPITYLWTLMSCFQKGWSRCGILAEVTCFTFRMMIPVTMMQMMLTMVRRKLQRCQVGNAAFG